MKIENLKALSLTLLTLATAAPALAQETERRRARRDRGFGEPPAAERAGCRPVRHRIFAASRFARWASLPRRTSREMTPGLNYTVPNAESSQINFFLRGVGLNDFADASENPVAVYVDDVYHPASGGLAFQLFDMDRVEVLRGPQGTLFGRNTTGGLIHYLSKKPGNQFDGYVDVTGGEFGQFKFEGAVGGPFSDTVSGRLSVATNNHDGYTKNRFAGAPDYNGADSKAARGQLRFMPSEALRTALVSAVLVQK